MVRTLTIGVAIMQNDGQSVSNTRLLDFVKSYVVQQRFKSREQKLIVLSLTWVWNDESTKVLRMPLDKLMHVTN